MNDLLSMIGGMGGNSGVGGTSIFMQAIGAFLRGEDASSFMRNLAKKDPRLKKVNLDDLYGSAQKLAQENGKDINDLTKKVDEMAAPYMSK